MLYEPHECRDDRTLGIRFECEGELLEVRPEDVGLPGLGGGHAPEHRGMRPLGWSALSLLAIPVSGALPDRVSKTA